MFWLCWAFVAACDFLCLRRAWATLCCGAWHTSHCSGFSCCRAQALGHTGSVVVAHEFGCPSACAIFPELGPNPGSLHWQGRYPISTARKVLQWVLKLCGWNPGQTSAISLPKHIYIRQGWVKCLKHHIPVNIFLPFLWKWHGLS